MSFCFLRRRCLLDIEYDGLELLCTPLVYSMYDDA
jgi:hypothetical protein